MNPPMTLGQLAERWLELRRARLKPRTVKKFEHLIRIMVKHIGDVPLGELTPALVEQWIIKRGNLIAREGYIQERTIVISVLRYASKNGAPSHDWKSVFPRRKPERKKPIVMPTKPEFQQIIARMREGDIRSQRAADFAELLAYSGMRLNEVASFRWCDADFDKAEFIVTGGERGTKNGEQRVVPLFPVMREHLERMAAARGGWAAINRRDRLFNIRCPRRAMWAACEKLGLPKFTRHSLRHFFVTNAIEAAVDFKTISYWVGHSDGGTLILKIYGHHRASHSREMAKRLTAPSEGRPAPVPAAPPVSQPRPQAVCIEPWL